MPGGRIIRCIRCICSGHRRFSQGCPSGSKTREGRREEGGGKTDQDSKEREEGKGIGKEAFNLKTHTSKIKISARQKGKEAGGLKKCSCSCCCFYKCCCCCHSCSCLVFAG